MSDIFWFVLGGFIGYALSFVRTRDADQPDTQRQDAVKKQEEDILYYKQLTKKLVNENKQLRKKINDAS